VKLAPASLGVMHAMVHRSLKKVVKDRLLVVNPAIDLEGNVRRRIQADRPPPLLVGH
jgi:hypothetical protein